MAIDEGEMGEIEKDAISIVLASDDNFALPLSVTIASLLQNAKSRRLINIYVIDGGISAAHRQKISDIIASKDFATICFLSVNNDDFAHFPLTQGFQTIATYYRLRLPSLLPVLPKVIYLDADIVVDGDISELWDTEMGDYPLWAVEEPYIHNKNRLHHLDMEEGSPYFNAGILMMNLAWMRLHRMEEKFVHYVTTHRQHLKFQDQDVLNGCFSGLWGALPPHWNKMPFLFMRYHKYKCYTKALLKKSRGESGIIHYNGEIKPWKTGCIDARRFHYKKNASLIGWDIPKSSKNIRAYLDSVFPTIVYDFRRVRASLHRRIFKKILLFIEMLRNCN